MKYITVMMLVVLLATFSITASGYEIEEVKDGAIIKGTVKFSGIVPSDETIFIDRDTKYCGEEQKLNKYIISDSKVKNSVVFIDIPQKGKPIPKDTVVDITIKRCKVDPLVSVGFVGGNFRFKNEDEILHTLQLKLWLEYQQRVSGRPLKEGATIYNLAFPKKGRELEKPIKGFHRYQPDTGFIRVTSNTHTWMRGYVFVFDHPYATVTDEKGSFVIDSLLPGEYVLKVWHEGFGMQERKIKVSPNEVLEVEIDFGK